MNWYLLTNAAGVPSPALLLYRDRIEENLRRMLALAGGPAKLRPHIKTHKVPELIRRQLELGINKFKCATIAEAEMAAAAGAPDVLLACQPVGPNVARLIQLVQAFPTTRFSTVADDAGAIHALAQATASAAVTLEALLDLDIGQHRTGVEPGPHAEELYRLVASIGSLTPGGLHAYDGHLHQTDLAERTTACEAAFAPVESLRQRLLAQGLPVPRVVVGGTPTFPMHARREGVECSPGTCVLWDAGYAAKLPDLNFQPAAVLLTRVLSKPASNRLCLDLGHKAVASEMPHPRAIFPQLPDAVAVAHNEEHLVLETPRAAEWHVGDCLYAIPWHVCPTVALHSEVWVVTDGRADTRWTVTARTRRLSI